MTTAAFKDGLRTSAGPGMGRDFGLVLAIILATLAGIFAVAFSAANARTGSGVADAAAAPALPVAAPRPAILRATRRDADSVEALIDAAARRYRISGTAMGEFIDMAFAEARRHRLDPLLIVAVMAVESRFNPVAQSDAGAKGLMQVIPHFHPEKFSATGGKVRARSPAPTSRSAYRSSKSTSTAAATRRLACNSTTARPEIRTTPMRTRCCRNERACSPRCGVAGAGGHPGWRCWAERARARQPAHPVAGPRPRAAAHVFVDVDQDAPAAPELFFVLTLTLLLAMWVPGDFPGSKGDTN